MKKSLNCSTVVLHFLFILILLHGKSNASPENNEMKNELRLVYEEIELLKEENRNQNHQIALLMAIIGFDEDKSKKFDQHSFDSIIPHPNKRPARLLPYQLLFNNRNESDNANQIRKFYGPPTNCSELSQLGYTLNGYYLVKSSITEITQLETVYCSFKQPGGVFNPSGSEQRVFSPLTHPKIGSVGTGVHFYVLLQSFFDVEPNAIIKFDDIKLNMGNGYNSNSGMFTAPKSGVYRFFFTANILGEQRVGMAALYRNGRIVGVAAKYPLGDTVPDRDPIIQAILEVKRGETITVKSALRKELPGGRKLSYFNLLSFTGSLLEEYKN